MSKSSMTVTQLSLLTALNMLGSGIIMLPAKIAEAGGITLLTWGVVSLASISMAYAFAYCGMHSKGKGGLGSIAQNAFGRFGGFITNFIYAISLVLANIAIATSGVAYLSQLFDFTPTKLVVEIMTVFLIWTSTAANLLGANFTGKLGAISIWGIFIPVLCLLCIAPFSFHAELFANNWNPHHTTVFEALKIGVPMMLWSFLGLESALANADSVENPEKAVPRAVLSATIGVTVVFVAATFLISGLLPNEVLAGQDAPVSVTFMYLLGPKTSTVLSFLIFVSMWGSLMGWQFTMARVFKVSADEGFFPKIFAEDVTRRVPVPGLLIIAGIQTLLVPLVSVEDVFRQFDVLVDLSVVTNIFPYLTCMAAVFVIAKNEPGLASINLSARLAASVALFFVMMYFFLIDSIVLKFAFIILLAGFVVYGVWVAGRAPRRLPD